MREMSTSCSLPGSVRDPSLAQVIRGKLHRDRVAGDNADEILAHAAGDMGCHHLAVLQLDAELRVREGLADSAGHFNAFFFRHDPPSNRNGKRPCSIITRKTTLNRKGKKSCRVYPGGVS